MIGNKAAPPNRRAALEQAQQDNLLCLFLYHLGLSETGNMTNSEGFFV